MAKKAAYHHGDLRQALIAGAIALIAEKKIESLSLREVARRAGVSHAAPYRHFADKEALLVAVAEEGFRDLTETLLSDIKPMAGDPLQQFQASGESYVRWGLSHPSHYRVMFGASQGNPENHPSFCEVSGRAFQVLVDIVIRAQEAGTLKSGDPLQMAHVAWALVHGFVMLVLDGQLSAEQSPLLLEMGARSLLDGLAVPQPENIE